MAKRYTDSDKWKKRWFRTLPPTYKCLWFYLLDNCNHAGVCNRDDESAEFHIGKKIDWTRVEVLFGNKIISVNGNKIFIPAFIEFQYGVLNKENKVHLSVIKILQKENLWKIYQDYELSLNETQISKNHDFL